MLFFPQALDEEIGFIAEGKKQFIHLFLIVENIGPVYSSQRVKGTGSKSPLPVQSLKILRFIRTSVALAGLVILR